VKWLEVSLCDLDGEGAEAAFDVLNRWGYGGAVIEQVVRDSQRDARREPVTAIRAYLPVDGTEQTVRNRIEQAIWHLGQLYPLPDPDFRTLDQTDWAEAWKKHYNVHRVGHRLVVVPSWQEFHPVPEDIVIRLDPGQAFGTGLHPSTRLCLLEIERLVRRPDRVMDVGTGSGILAIVAAKLGAGEVLAIDNDPVAVTAAQENVSRNHVCRVRVAQATVGTLPDPPVWNLIVVNILAEVIASMMPELARRLAVGGHLILSGIIEEHESIVQTALEGVGLHLVRQNPLHDWVALTARKS